MVKYFFSSGSFPPPIEGGSIQYVFNIISHLPSDQLIVHTGRTSISSCRSFDRTIRFKIIRSIFIRVVLGHKTNGKFFDKIIVFFIEYFFRPIVTLFWIIWINPKIVFFTEICFTSACIVALRRIIKKPIVLFAYGEELTKLGVDNLHGGWLRYTIKRSAAIISVSDYTSGLLVNLGADEKIIHKVLPSVGVKKIQRYSDNQLTEFRKELGLENKTVILTVSRLERRKNHELVIRTLPLIIESIPNVIYVIVGGGKLKVELEKLVEELNLVNNVKFAGEIDDELLTRYYKIAKLFILPHIELPETHDTEGCPTVFFEACANGVPVISGQAGGVKDVIRDGYNGLTVSGKSTFELKSKVFEILLNTEIQLKLIRNGYEMVKYNTPEKNAEKITKICENLYY